MEYRIKIGENELQTQYVGVVQRQILGLFWIDVTDKYRSANIEEVVKKVVSIKKALTE